MALTADEVRERMRAACRRYYASHKKQVYEKSRRLRRANLKRDCERSKRYYWANLEKVKARQKLYRRERREKVNADNRRWRAAHTEQENKRIAAWAKAHPEQRTISADRRRILKHGNGGSHTVVQWKQLCWASSWQCAYCAGVLDARTAHRDHVVPVIRGGSDNIENIAVSCRLCNAKKGSTTAEEFRARQQLSRAVSGG